MVHDRYLHGVFSYLSIKSYANTVVDVFSDVLYLGVFQMVQCQFYCYIVVSFNHQSHNMSSTGIVLRLIPKYVRPFKMAWLYHFQTGIVSYFQTGIFSPFQTGIVSPFQTGIVSPFQTDIVSPFKPLQAMHTNFYKSKSQKYEVEVESQKGGPSLLTLNTKNGKYNKYKI